MQIYKSENISICFSNAEAGKQSNSYVLKLK